MTTTPVAPVVPDDEQAAHRLAMVLLGQDVVAYSHWDRSPWGVRIPLTDDHSEYAPALYVLTENVPISEELGGRRWFGQLGNFPDALQDDLYDTTFEWLERSFNGDDVDAVAKALCAFVPILKTGVIAVKGDA